MVSPSTLDGMTEEELRENIERLEEKSVLTRQERQDLSDYQEELFGRGRERFEMPDMTV